MFKPDENDEYKTERNNRDDFPFNQKVVNDFSAN